MRVTINALAYKQSSSGIGVLIRELFGTYTARMTRSCTVVLPQDGPDFPHGGAVTTQLRTPCRYGQGLRRIWFQTFQLGRLCWNSVLLTTDSKTPFFLPPSCTLLPLITDLAVFRMGEVYQFSRMLWWRLQYCYVRHSAKRFLAVSEFTKAEMVALWHLAPAQVEVVPCACPSHIRRVTDAKLLSAFRERFRLPEQFILFVGNSNPRKNLRRMMEAFDQAKRRGNLPHQLVIAGEQGWKFDRDTALQGLEHASDICFVGYVPDEDMSALYTAAELFVFPTLYEGFGIPVLEAQTCGTPVLASNRSALPEVGGEGALYANPYSPEDICAGMLKILQNKPLREDLIAAGYKNTARYSWAVSAETLENIIERIAEE